MHYTKPPLDFSQQADLLISRGLQANKKELQNFLEKVNYYRLTGYLYPFRKTNSDNFCDGTTLQQIKSIYTFDSKLRHLTFSAIEQIEISILRTQLVEEFTLHAGTFCYTNNQFFNGLAASEHQNLLFNIDQSVKRSREEFVKNYQKKYVSETYLPFWMVAEIISMSQLSKIFHYSPNAITIPIAKRYNLHSTILKNWLHVLTVIRNKTAHHSRLWNVGLAVRPRLPIRKYHPEFYSPYPIHNTSYQSILAIMLYLLNIINTSNTLLSDFNKLLSNHPEVSISNLGLPVNWQDSPLFKIKS